MAGFTTQSTHGHVIARDPHQGRTHTGHGIRNGSGSAVTLCAIGTGRGRIRVDVDQRWHHRVVGAGVARGARGRGRYRNMVGRL